MVGILGGLAYSSLMGLSHVLFLQRGLTLAAIPAIQKRAARIASFVKNTELASRNYVTWTMVWMPIVVITIVNTGWMWYLFAHDTEVSLIHMGISSILIGGILTVTYTKGYLKNWVFDWDNQLNNARDGVILEALSSRLRIIEQLFADAGIGKTNLTDEETDILLMEVTAIQHVSAEIQTRQEKQIAALRNIKT